MRLLENTKNEKLNEKINKIPAEKAALKIHQRKEHWYDPLPNTFLKKDIPFTTILTGGLTITHDYFIEAALKGIGYKVKSLDCPDLESLRYGKEFGNRGQCNPTYFTVGNLIKYLNHLHHQEGITKEDITKNYVFITSGSCGPCRFGTYSTEYRKALRDAGFEGFRVLLFQQQNGLKQAAGEESYVTFDRSFFIAIVKAMIIGDILNELGYRIRPYEVNAGDTDKVIDYCKKIIYQAFSERKSLLPILWHCRKKLNNITVDRTLVKPRVSIIGEFWAMTTEGDGNYRLQRFIEDEGAEVEVQSVTAWILYLIWAGKFDTKKRMDLKQSDNGRYGLQGKNPYKKLLSLSVADKVVRASFQFYAKALGLRNYILPNMNEIAEVANQYYNNLLRGGEGHMEVGKLLLNVKKKKANMTISVKPFGCMPSSGVSDGVQTYITEKYPESIFLPIETTGDGAINVYSRIQMMLFKAKQAAQTEFDCAIEETGLSLEDVKNCKQFLSNNALTTSRHVVACTAANFVYSLKSKKNASEHSLQPDERPSRDKVSYDQ